jgi:hypothetical protein
MSLSFLYFFRLSSEKNAFDEMRSAEAQIQEIKFDRDVFEEE